MIRISTKERIVNTAIQLFNQQGYGESSLQDLAGKLSMSRGNLTYHYPDKEQLLVDIAKIFEKSIKSSSEEASNLPSFANLHQEVAKYFQLQEDYAFIFRDPFVIRHPAIKPIFRKITKQAIRNNKAAIAFAIQLENLNPEPYPGLYQNLAENTVMLMLSAYPRDILLEDFSLENLERSVWSMLLPHLTPKGVKSFKNYFGANFLDKLGPKFNFNLEIF